MAADSTFSETFAGLSLLLQARTTWAEARKAKFVHLCQAYVDAEDTPAALRAMSNKLIEAWRMDKDKSSA